MAIRSLIIKIGAETSGVDKALKDLGSEAKKTDDQLKRLGEGSGVDRLRKQIDDATGSTKDFLKEQAKIAGLGRETAAGIEKIGGVTKLTAAQQKQFTRTVEEGLSAYKALGIEAPKSLTNISTALKQQQTAIAQSQSGLSKMVTTLGPLGPALTGALSAGAVIGFGKAMLDSADALTKMSDRTGIGVVGLQRLEAVATASGNSLDQITSAVNSFQTRLTEGQIDAPIQRLGLAVDDLKAMNPDEQFIAIAKAIGSISDPAKQTAAAVEIFGKSGAELLPTMKADIDAIADSTFKLSSTTVQALAEAGDAWDLFKISATNAVTETVGQLLYFNQVATKTLGGFLDNFRGVQDFLRNVPKAPSGPGLAQPTPLAATPEMAFVGIRKLEEAEAKLAETRRKNEESARKAAEAQKALIDRYLDQTRALKPLTTAQEQSIIQLTQLGWKTEDVAALTHTGTREVAAFQDQLSDLATIETTTAGINPIPWLPLLKPTKGALEDVEAVMARIAELNKGMGAVGPLGGEIDLIKPGALPAKTGLGPAFAAAFSGPQFGNLLTQAFLGGGGVKGAFQGIGTEAGNIFGDSLGKSLQKNIGGTLGKTIGGFLGPIGSVLGGLGGTLLAKVFGDPEKEINPIRESMIKAAGGLGAINEQARQAGTTLDRVLQAKNAKQYEAAIGDLNAAFQRQQERLSGVNSQIGALASAVQAAGGRMPADLRATLDTLIQMQGLPPEIAAALQGMAQSVAPDMQQLQQRAAEFGVSLEALGPKFQSADIDRRTKTITDLFADLTEVGGDAGGVLVGLADEISGLVDDAKRFGVALPESLRPIVENLLEAGKLTNTAGDQLEDLSGVNFKETPLDKSTNAIVEAIDRLGDLLKGLPAIAGAAAQGITDSFRGIRPKLIVDVEANPLGPAIEHAATGGIVTDHGIQRFASGGRVLPFLRRGTDSVAAMLTPGELVLNVGQQRNVAAALTGGPSMTVAVYVQNNRDITTITEEHRMGQRVSKAIMSEVNRAFRRGR